jgi:3-oxosteroid 1-dehydrogenase
VTAQHFADHTSVDVVVVGSGAAALVAACRAADAGLSVAVLEKANLLGGTSALGGGVMWIPNNHLMGPQFKDSDDDALTYLKAATAGTVPDDRLRWYISVGRQAVRYLCDETKVNLVPLPRPDYHPEWPGAVGGGRSLDNVPFEGSDYPGLSERIRPPTYFPTITMIERDEWGAAGLDTQLIAKRERAGTRTMGGALVCALVASAEERNVRIVNSCAVRDLRRDPRRRWTVTAHRSADMLTLEAGAVVLASGGFEWNERLRAAFLPNPITPISAPSNEGDGLQMGMAVGAALDNMTAVWGVPVLQNPDHVYDGKQSGRMANVELTLPGAVLVNRFGRRFVNEATNYHDLNKVFRTIDPQSATFANVPAWMLFDSAYVARYSIGGGAVGTAPAWAVRAESLEALADRCGIDMLQLAATVAQFNQGAAQGVDPAFHRGESIQDRHLGDPTNRPNPCLAPLAAAPFLAIPIMPGTLGTCGGLVTNNDGQVLDRFGETMDGLFAAGNVSAGVFRDAYPGGGATLGSAITRAYAVGLKLAGLCIHQSTV